MAGNGSAAGDLTHRQQAAVRTLLACKSVAEAAQRARVGERTLYRWLADPAFRAALSAAEGDLLDAATRRLLALQEDAIGAFEAVLRDAHAAPSARLRAAQAVLDYLLKLRELRDVEQRLTALEQAVEQQAAHRRAGHR